MKQAGKFLIGLILTAFLGAVSAEAQVLRNVNDRQVQSTLQRLETKTDTFRRSLERRLDNDLWEGTTQAESVSAYVTAFENATDDLRNNFNARRATATDVNNVLNYGWYIDDFMRRNRLATAVEQQWVNVRSELNMLARYYRVAWNWNRTMPPFPQGQYPQNGYGQLTGTYRLNTSLSDNVATAITRSLGNRRGAAQNRQRTNLQRRLSSPQDLAIEMRGNSVTLSTNYSQPVSFQADGRVNTEYNNRGVATRTTVSLSGNTLTVNTDGDRANDFWVTFTPISNNRLRMTRRIYLENRNETITVSSVYDRVSNVAQFPAVNGRPDWNQTGSVGTFYIPNGTQLTAVLRNRVATNVSQAGDPFTMEVTSPSQYRGAIITGRISELEKSGRITGRANLSMDFETIRFGNRTYNFAGIIDSAREADGDEIRISNEGSVSDGNQTTRTVTRAGIGAALGALIGAIVSGGDGALIGAGVGAGAGAGTVLIQGRDNIDLQAGSEFRITATGPTNTNVGQRVW